MKRGCPTILMTVLTAALLSGAQASERIPSWQSGLSKLQGTDRLARRRSPIAASFSPRTSLVWFTADGVPTHSASQGQYVTWAANCLASDTLQWEIWIDANANGQFDTTGSPAGDRMLFSYSTANGDTTGQMGLPDTTAAADLEIVNRLKCGFAPALYWFRAISLVDGTRAHDSLRVHSLPSPWATVSGHVHVPGDSSLQQGIWIEANLATDGDDSEPIFWAALTDSFGNYSIPFDNAHPDSIWRIGNLEDITSGGAAYVAPPNVELTVTAGPHPGVDFSYLMATDSITGDVTQHPSGSLPFEPYVWCRKQDQSEKMTTTVTGHYQLFFAAPDTGQWEMGLWWEEGTEGYMRPDSRRDLVPVGAGHLVEDFIVYPANDSIKGTVTENGGPPAGQYRMVAYSDSLRAVGIAVNQPGSGQYTLHVSGLVADYRVALVDDYDYPIPTGWMVDPQQYYPVDPPAQGLDFDLYQATEFITGTVTQDTSDSQPVDFSRMGIDASWGTEGAFHGYPDSTGHYVISVVSDTFTVRAGSQDPFLFKPSEHRDLYVAPNDTVENVDFIANYGHCRVQVSLVGYPAGDTNYVWGTDSAGHPQSYATGVQVTGPGTYEVRICNSNGWRFYPPDVGGYTVTPPMYELGDITHADTAATVTFTYTAMTELITGTITQDPGDAVSMNFTQAWVSAQPYGGYGFGVSPNGSGYYSIGVLPDTYNVYCSYDTANGWFLFRPLYWDSVIVNAGDTVTGIDFTANYGHCRVPVNIAGLPPDSSLYIWAADTLGWSDGYATSRSMTGSGTVDLYLCNSVRWVIGVKPFDNYSVSPSIWQLVGDITHADTLRGPYTFTYTYTGVEGGPQAPALPKVYALSQNRPNPARSSARIEFQLPAASGVSLSIYNILGQEVRRYDRGTLQPGYHHIVWDGNDRSGRQVSSGLYFYRLEAGDFTATRRMSVLR